MEIVKQFSEFVDSRCVAAVGLVFILGVACGESAPAGPPQDVVVFLGDSLVYGGAGRG